MCQNLFSPDELTSLKKDVCKKMDSQIKEAGEVLHHINIFNGLEESDSSLAVLSYLNYRYKDIIDDFLDCHEDFIRLIQIIQVNSLTLPKNKRVPEASDGEFLERAKKQYSQ